VRVAVVDDYEIVVAGIAALLAPYDDRVHVVELAAGRRPALCDVDVVLYDTFGHTHDHDVEIKDLASGGDVKVVVFSWNVETLRVTCALEQGAAGYIAKSLPAEAIVTALERVHAGEVVVPHEVEADLATDTVSWPGAEHGLSHREAEVIALVAQGLSNEEIAARLYLSINSIKTYIRTAYRKIGVTRRSQSVAWAMTHGFVTYDVDARRDRAGRE